MTRLEAMSVQLRTEVEANASALRSDSKNALLRHLRGTECAAAVERQRIERGISTRL